MSSIWPEAEPSELLVLSGADLARLLERDALIEAMAGAMQAYSSGDAVVPLRTVLRLPGDSVRLLAAMPGFLGRTGSVGRAGSSAAGAAASASTGAARAGNAGGPDRGAPTSGGLVANLSADALGAKLVSVYPANSARGLESHYGLVMLFAPDTGRPAAVLDGTFITTARTAAVSAVSVRLLAREDAAVLAVIGAGVQARAHLWALAGVRGFREARIASQHPAHAEQLAAAVAAHLPFPVRAFASIEQAVRDADVVVTATSAATPVMQRDWLKPGTHIVAVGSSTPSARELDSRTVGDALLIVDSRTGALAEAGDILIPLQEGLIDQHHIHAELGELLAGTRPGRGNPAQITLYKSLGLAVQDLAAAHLALQQAIAADVGIRVRL